MFHNVHGCFFRRQMITQIAILKFFLQSTPVGTTVFRGIRAQDVDAGVNGLVEYSIIDSQDEKDEENGYGIFTINLPHQGAVTLNRTLDYERSQRYYVTIVASVSERNTLICDYAYLNFIT